MNGKEVFSAFSHFAFPFLVFLRFVHICVCYTYFELICDVAQSKYFALIAPQQVAGIFSFSVHPSRKISSNH
jgi:hypothetical protein